MVGVVLVERKGRIDCELDCLESGERLTCPNKPEAMVDGWEWTNVGLREWCWGQWFEVGRAIEVLVFEVDLRWEMGEEHCSILAIEGLGSRGVHSLPWHNPGEPPMERWRNHLESVQGFSSSYVLCDWFPQSKVQQDGQSTGK